MKAVPPLRLNRSSSQADVVRVLKWIKDLLECGFDEENYPESISVGAGDAVHLAGKHNVWAVAFARTLPASKTSFDLMEWAGVTDGPAPKLISATLWLEDSNTPSVAVTNSGSTDFINESSLAAGHHTYYWYDEADTPIPNSGFGMDGLQFSSSQEARVTITTNGSVTKRLAGILFFHGST